MENSGNRQYIPFTSELNFGEVLIVGSLSTVVRRVLLIVLLLLLVLLGLVLVLVGRLLLVLVLLGLELLGVLFLNARALFLSDTEFDLFLLGCGKGSGSRTLSIFPFDARRTIEIDFSLYSFVSSFRDSVTPVRRREDTEGDGDTGVKVQIAGLKVFSMPFELSLNNSKDSRKDLGGEVFLEGSEKVVQLSLECKIGMEEEERRGRNGWRTSRLFMVGRFVYAALPVWGSR